MLELNYNSLSLNILSALSDSNMFEVEDYFGRAVKELNLSLPSFETCAEEYIKHLARTILADETEAISLASEIYEVAVRLDFPAELEAWIHISDMIDDYRYSDNFSNLSKVALMVKIEAEAKNELKRKK